MKIEIKKRLEGSVIFTHECENNTVKLALEAAVKASANLRCANLYGAIIADDFICDGKFHRITNVGSESGTLELYSCGDSGWYIKRGCFHGSKQEFLDAVAKKHGDNEHGKKYRAIVELFCGV